MFVPVVSYNTVIRASEDFVAYTHTGRVTQGPSMPHYYEVENAISAWASRPHCDKRGERREREEREREEREERAKKKKKRGGERKEREKKGDKNYAFVD